MNKAFIRESESTRDHCPRCGSEGIPVDERTVLHHLRHSQLLGTAAGISYCPAETCSVVYFDGFERFVLIESLKCPPYPKDPAAPICVCFGVTCDDIQRDIDEGTSVRTRALLERAKSAEARCEVLAVSGRSCVAQVQKYFLKQKGMHR